MSNKNKQETILVPIDFSEQSIAALELAIGLAKVYPSEIHVLNVVTEEFSLSKLFSDDDKSEFEKRARTRLDEFVEEKGQEYNVDLYPVFMHGKIYEQIVNAADVIDATVIIMGTTGSRSRKRMFIGSNALRVTRESHKPVITVKQKHPRKGCQNIVLPLDLTKETKEKVAMAIRVSKWFGATVRVVSILMTNDEFVVNRLTRQLDQVKKIIEEQEVDCTAEIVRDSKSGHSLSASIIDYANKCKGDLIMIMTQQETDFTDFFIGSSAQEMIKNSDIPVLSIIPTPKKETTTIKPF